MCYRSKVKESQWLYSLKFKKKKMLYIKTFTYNFIVLRKFKQR